MLLKNKYFKYVFGIVLFTASIFFGCSYEDDPESGGNLDYVGLNLYFNIPGSVSKVRSVSAAGEEFVGNVNVLVFTRESGGTDEVFDYIAPIQNDSQIADNTMTVRLRRSVAGEVSRLVLIANMDVSATDFTGLTKDQAMQIIGFSSSGKWNAVSDTNSRIFPMWGETAPTIINDNTVFGTISLLRSIARIDVGINFTNIINGSEDASGISGISLQEVYLYGSMDRGLVVPAPEYFVDGRVTSPSVPVDAVTNPRIDYTDLTDPNKFVRSIYLAESDASADMGLVVGLMSEGTVTYYKINFADGDNNLLSVLRNHRYVFNILSVRGTGFPDPDTAMDSEAANIEWEVTEWDQSITDITVSGNYYIAFDRRQVVLGVNAGSSADVIFQTNLAENNISLSWQNAAQQDYSVVLDYSGSRITITTLADNAGRTSNRNQVLLVTAGSMVVQIDVSQNLNAGAYTIDCSSIRIHGTYVRGIEVDPGNYITMTINAEFTGGEYEITTPEIGGVSFSGEGVITISPQTVILNAVGTPEIAGNVVFPIITNSSIESSCFARAVFGYSTKKLLCMGRENTTAGYYIQSSGSLAMMSAEINFGMNINSTVKVDGLEFSYIHGNATNFTNGVVNLNTLNAALNEKPDIVVLGYYVMFDDSTISAFINYVDQGGILILLNEVGLNINNSALRFFRTFYNNTNINAGSVGTGATYALTSDIDDVIMNGPFGDFRGLRWGQDLGGTLYMTNLPASDIYVYSTTDAGGNNVAMFRDRARYVFFVGDGGFVSNNNLSIGSGAALEYYYYPFTIDSNFRPISNLAYSNGPIHNSELFGNLMAWAIREADYNGINAIE